MAERKNKPIDWSGIDLNDEQAVYDRLKIDRNPKPYLDKMAQYGSDAIAGIGTGIAKIPSDIGHLVAPNNFISNGWEGGVNTVRNWLQSDQLNQERKALSELFAGKYKGNLSKDFVDEAFEKYPYGASQYLAEMVTPTRLAVKGGSKFVKYASDNSRAMSDYIKGKIGYLADIGGVIGDIQGAQEQTEKYKIKQQQLEEENFKKYMKQYSNDLWNKYNQAYQEQEDKALGKTYNAPVEPQVLSFPEGKEYLGITSYNSDRWMYPNDKRNTNQMELDAYRRKQMYLYGKTVR